MSGFEEDQVVLSSAITVAPDTTNPDSIIETVRNVRVRTLNVQLAHGCQAEGDGFEAMHKNLQELEKSAVAEKRLKLDESKASDDGAFVRAIAKEMYRMNNQRPLLQVGDGTGVIPDPSIDFKGELEEVPGMIEIGNDARKYDDFMATAGNDIEERVRSGELLLNEI